MPRDLIVRGLLIAMVVAPSVALAGAGDGDKVAGDILQFAPPMAALSAAWLKDDSEGVKQAWRTVAASTVATQLTKLAFNSTSLGRRPDGGAGSFPSGHTALAASGAAFLTERYGWEYGLPAWAATGYVAWSRVDEHRHHWWDVAAGAALSLGTSKLFVTPLSATHLAPVIGPDFVGLRWERSW